MRSRSKAFYMGWRIFKGLDERHHAAQYGVSLNARNLEELKEVIRLHIKDTEKPLFSK
ncbi:MAG: hypothetical protein JW384_02790 [Nitrosomonadaceae bacterium]|nr:hypothetical protein [Nitrosomonadaceae bacterium]